MSPREKNARIKFHLACGGCTEGWITNISARSSVARGATMLLICHRLGSELGGIGSWRILSMDSERLRAPFTRLARIYRASDLSDRICRKSKSLSVLSKIALMISMYLQFKYIEI